MLRILLYISLLSTVIGCAQSSLPVQFVEGTVTLDGVPVADADVGFTPKAGSGGVPAVGKTDTNGYYRLTSAQGGEFGKGAVVGEYDVRVMKYLDLDIVAPVNPQPGDHVPLANPKHHLPERYADANTSGLSATVKKGKNSIDFNLEK